MMIHLFRTLKNRLLTEKRFTRYLLYSVGEIILVVIGILIAVEVNDWSEEQKKRTMERSILLNIQEEILLDTIDLSFNIAYHKDILHNEKLLLSLIQQRNFAILDSVDFVAALGVPLIAVLHTSSFTNLKFKNLDIVADPDLRKEISRHYDFFYSTLDHLENRNVFYDFYERKLQFFARHFKSVAANRKMAGVLDSEQYFNQNFHKTQITPVSVQELMNDNEFAFTLSEIIYHRSFLLSIYEDTFGRIKTLNENIRSALNL